MKKFQFTLEKVYRYKNQQLDIEMNALAALRYTLVQKEEQITQLRLHVKLAYEAYVSETERGMSNQALQEYQYMQETRKLQIEQAEKEKEVLIRQIDEQLRVVLELKKDVSGLEKLKEKQWEAFLEEQRKADAEFILEMVSAKVARAKTGDS